MTDDVPGEVTRLLDAIRAGDEEAKEQLASLVYSQLHREAARQMRRERADHTLQPSALVNEAFARLLEQDMLRKSPNRHYFFGVASEVMRRILVEHVRAQKAAKRGGDRRREPFDALLDYYKAQKIDVLAVHEALDELAAIHKRPSQVVELHIFGGLKHEEVAEQLDVSVATVRNDFKFARAWLHKHLREEEP